MKKTVNKTSSVLLSVLLIISMVMPGLNVFSANPTITVTDENGAEITQTIEVQEYRSVQLSYVTSDDTPDDAYVSWESNLPLLADVDNNGKITGYDYSKAAIIQLWLDEEVRATPIIGESLANTIEAEITSGGYDLETINTDILVTLVRGIAGDTLADSLKKYLDNMNVEITATLYDKDGNKLSSDTVNVLVTQSIIASVAPTGVHITNKKTVPTTVAVGTSVQLYGACTPVRLKQGIKWAMGSSILDTASGSHANITEDGLVTFTSAGNVTVRVNPSSALYAAYSDTVTFTVVEQSELPVTDFTISGTTSVAEGATTQLSIDNITPAGAYTGDVVWTSSDPDIAAVDQNGIVTGLDAGSGLVFSKTATITAKTGDIEKQITVTVTRSITSSTISGVEISGETVITNNSTAQYTATVFPSRLNTNSSVTREWGLRNADGTTSWATADAPAVNSLASITANGTMTSLASGIINVAVRATYNSTVVESTLQVTSGKAITDFTISGTTTVTEAATTQLSITGIIPDDYDSEILASVQWRSEDKTIAIVDQNGVVTGIDGGGTGSWNTKKVNITATIGGVTKTVEVTVRGSFISYITNADINGPDYVIKDFPATYTSSFAPSRVSISKQLWGLPNDEGTAPWNASNTLNSSGNMANSVASVSESGVVTGYEAGTTTLYLFGRHNYTSHIETTREITVVEIEPKSMSITAPSKTDYIEGETELDLTGLKVQLTYDRNDIKEYYGEAADALSDTQLTVDVTDYKISEIKQNILDNEQYIIVTVERAGKEYRGIFGITLASKALTGIEITSPQYKYLEGTTALNLSELTVKANYSNAESEFVTDYTVDTASFNTSLFNTEQIITVKYEHAGRTASATFPVIIYGIPVVSVDTNGYLGGWTSSDVVFSLDSTNKLDGVTYYYRTDKETEWKAISGSTFTVSDNESETYYFKAINSENIESAETGGFSVSRDDVTPTFSLSPEITDVTNQSYSVSVNDIVTGASGVSSVKINDTDVTDNKFTVDENGDYTVVVTAGNGLFSSRTITISNIDKQKPTVNSITMAHKNTGTVARILNSVTFGKFFNEQIEITIDATDEGVAGIDTVEYRFLDENGLPTGNDWQVYNSSSKPTQDPNFKGFVEARATDKASNESDALRSDGYVIDGDKPTDVLLSAKFGSEDYTDGKWVSDSVDISLSSTAFSDIFEYRYRIDGGDWQTVTDNRIIASLEGEHLYEFKSISNAALDSEITSITVKIDRQTPVIRVDFDGTFGRWTGEDVNFGFSTLESSLSGITYYYNTGNGWVEITTGDSITLSENTNATYRFMAVNGAGTQSNPSDSYIVMIDAEVPSITATATVTDSTCQPYAVNIAATAGEAGIRSVTMNGTDITGQTSVTVSKNGTYLFTVTGNNLKTSTYVLEIDNFFNPVLEITGISFDRIVSGSYSRKTDDEFGEYYNENTTITITAQNTGVSGIEKIEYRLLDENGNASGEWMQYNSADKPVIKGGFKGSVEARAYDGNSAVSQTFSSSKITVDTSAPSTPEITAVSDGKQYTGEWTGGEITFALSSTAFSGIYNYQYRMDGAAWQNIDGNAVTVREDGIHTYEFKAVSNADIESATASFGAKTEAQAPALQVGVEGTLGTKTGNDVNFTLYAPNVVSGVSYYYNNGNGWNELPDGKLTVDETITAAYKFKAVNAAGVESLVSPDYNVILDKNYDMVERIPGIQVGVSGTVGTFTSENVTFTLSSYNTKESVTYYFNDGTGFKAINGNTLTVNSDTDKTYTFKVIDGTNKESSESEQFQVRIDKAAPSLNPILSTQTMPNDTIKVTLNAAAGISGVKSITLNGVDISTAKTFDITDNGEYQICVTANNGLSASKTITISSFDTQAPQITDLTLKQVNTGSFARLVNKVSFGLFFNEKVEISATAVDLGTSGIKNIEYRLLDENGDPAGEWQTYNNEKKPLINADFKGFAEVRATDNANNISSAVKSDGFTLDLENPTDVLISAVCDGKPYDGSFVNKNVDITLSSTAFSDIYEYRYRIDGGEWSSLESNTLSAVDGVHKYEFKAVSYSANESAVSAITTKVETGVPVISVNSDGVFGEWTKDNITFSLSSTNTVSGVTYYYNDGSGFKVMNGNMLVVDDSQNKTYTFKAVNSAGGESTVSDNYIVMIDKTMPEISVSADTDKFTNGDVKLSVKTSNIGISGIKSVTMNGADITGVGSVTVQTNGTYTFTVTDNNGLSSSTDVVVENIDKSVPDIIGAVFTHTNGLSAVKNNVFNTQAVLSINAVDAGTSGIAKIQYRVVDSDSIVRAVIWHDYDETAKPVINGDFKGYVEIKVTDNAGNTSQVFTSDSIVVEKNAPSKPVITATSGEEKYASGEWTQQDVQISLSSGSFAGLETYLIKTDNGEWEPLNGSEFTASQNGVHIYKFQAVSVSGLVSEISEIQVKIEKNAPVLTVNTSGNTGTWTSEGVVFVLSASNTDSGITYYCNDGDGFKKMSSNTLTLYKEQNKTYTFKAVNGLGAESNVSPEYVVMIDAKGPVSFGVTAQSGGNSLASGSTVNSDIIIDLSSSAFSDIAKYQYSLNGSDWVDVDGKSVQTNGNGTYNYKFRAVSQSGVVSDETSFSVTVNSEYKGTANNQGEVPATDNSQPSGSKPVYSVDIPKTGAQAAGYSTLGLMIAAAAVIAVAKKKKQK